MVENGEGRRGRREEVRVKEEGEKNEENQDRMYHWTCQSES
jgi:hypothetical protein